MEPLSSFNNKVSEWKSEFWKRIDEKQLDDCILHEQEDSTDKVDQNKVSKLAAEYIQRKSHEYLKNHSDNKSAERIKNVKHDFNTSVTRLLTKKVQDRINENGLHGGKADSPAVQRGDEAAGAGGAGGSGEEPS